MICKSAESCKMRRYQSIEHVARAPSVPRAAPNIISTKAPDLVLSEWPASSDNVVLVIVALGYLNVGLLYCILTSISHCKIYIFLVVSSNVLVLNWFLFLRFTI